MRRPTPQNQHYVPKLLLRNFSASNSDHVWAFDKSNKQIFGGNIKGFASEKGFYDLGPKGSHISLENFLGEIETKAAPILSEILISESLSQLTESQKHILSDFFAIQFIRTKNARESHHHGREAMYNALIRKGIPEDIIAKSEFSKKSKDETAKEFLLEITNYPTYSRPLFSHDWTLHISPSGGLYISDNPVCLSNDNPSDGMFSNLGLLVPGIQVYIPISNRLLIGIFCRTIRTNLQMLLELTSNFKKQGHPLAFEAEREAKVILEGIASGKPIPLTPSNVRHYNSLQVIFSERFLYSSTDDFSLALEMLEKFPETSTGPRTQVT